MGYIFPENLLSDVLSLSLVEDKVNFKLLSVTGEFRNYFLSSYSHFKTRVVKNCSLGGKTTTLNNLYHENVQQKLPKLTRVLCFIFSKCLFLSLLSLSNT